MKQNYHQFPTQCPVLPYLQCLQPQTHPLNATHVCRKKKTESLRADAAEAKEESGHDAIAIGASLAAALEATGHDVSTGSLFNPLLAPFYTA